MWLEFRITQYPGTKITLNYIKQLFCPIINNSARRLNYIKQLFCPIINNSAESKNKFRKQLFRKFGPVPFDLIDGKMFWKVCVYMI